MRVTVDEELATKLHLIFQQLLDHLGPVLGIEGVQGDVGAGAGQGHPDEEGFVVCLSLQKLLSVLLVSGMFVEVVIVCPGGCVIVLVDLVYCKLSYPKAVIYEPNQWRINCCRC